MKILSLVILAMIGEAVWETAKMVWQNGKLSTDRIGAIAIGELLAIGAGMDMLAMVGIPLKIPYVGMILTGLLISRGANFIHDLLSSINNVQQNTKPASVIEINSIVQKEKPIQDNANPTAEKPAENVTAANTTQNTTTGTVEQK